MDADEVRTLPLRYIEESRLSKELSEQMLRKILKILFDCEPDEKWMEAARTLLIDGQKP